MLSKLELTQAKEPTKPQIMNMTNISEPNIKPVAKVEPPVKPKVEFKSKQ